MIGAARGLQFGPRLLPAVLGLASLLVQAGCASHSEHMLPVRTALDEGQPREAIRLLDDEMGVKSDHALPADLDSDNALYVLDRGSMQQSVTQFDASRRDL